ncbi:MAG: four helix bundle protein [Bacteriovoracaceae bacterium]|nr:four helix bundle protein [Bacteriovoracaceae bacterium]
MVPCNWVAQSIIQKLPKGRREFKNQLQKASLSIVLNFAERYGKYSLRDKQRFY